jgi:hypothetical protein
MTDNSGAPRKSRNRLLGNIILLIVVLLSVTLAVVSVRGVIQKQKETTNNTEFKKITTNLEKPSTLFTDAKKSSSSSSILKNAMYKESPVISKLLTDTATVLNGKSTKEVITDPRLTSTKQQVNSTLVGAYDAIGKEAGSSIYSYNIVTRDASIDKETPRYDKFVAQVRKALEEACDTDNGKCTAKKDGRDPKKVYYTLSIGQFPQNKLAFRLYINTLITY